MTLRDPVIHDAPCFIMDYRVSSRRTARVSLAGRDGPVMTENMG
jgi:hypothetical protein